VSNQQTTTHTYLANNVVQTDTFMGPPAPSSRPSVARSTERAMNASGQALSAAQLAALDTNRDGQITSSEAANHGPWRQAA